MSREMSIKNRKFKALRVFRGFTQAQLAEKIGIDQTYISLIETGKAIPTGGIKEKLASILEADPVELFKET